MPRILVIAGARPNFIKVAPLIAAMRRLPDLDPFLVHTGQHYDPALSDVFFSQLGIPQPDAHLGVGSGSHAAQTAQIMTAFEPICVDGAAMVVVVGDVNSTLACALVAAKLGIPVAHVEAGLRSFDWSMPEEINRVVTDRLSQLLFTTERSANENLIREGIPPERIHFVGNVMIDTLLQQRGRALALGMPGRLGLPAGGYALVTLHRPGNVDSPETLLPLLDALARIADTTPVVFPLHPRTAARIDAFGLRPRLAKIHVIEPIGYLEFLGLMSEAKVVITDSGGIQEETTVLGVPCLTLRPNTERPVTIEQGTNRLVPLDTASIVRAASSVGEIVDRARAGRALPELWDGRAADRIVGIISRYLNAQ